MRPYQVSLTGLGADANGLVTSVTPAAGGEQELTLLAAAADLDPPRRVMITSAGDETGRTFTITGVRRHDDKETSEEVTGANAGTALSAWEYKSVSSITVDDDTAGAIEVGWNAEFYTQWLPLDIYISPFAVSIGVEVEGTVDYDVEHSLQPDLLSVGPRSHSDPLNQVHTHDTLDGDTASADGNYAFPVSAVRLKLNSGTGTAHMSVYQAGGR